MKWNIVQQFLYSFYHYKNVSVFRFQKIGRSIGYIFLLTLIATIPLMINTSIQSSKALNSVNDEILSQVPDFSVDDGTLKLKGHDLYMTNHGSVLFTNQEEWENGVSDGIVFSKTKISLVADSSPVSEFQYSLLGLGNASKQQVLETIQTIQSLKWFILIIYFSFYYLFAVGVKFIEVSILAALGLYLKTKMNKNINYQQSWNLSAYALTIPAILVAWADAAPVTLPFSGLVFWGGAGIILYRIMTYIPSPKTQI
ncbi:MAG: DUF1189 domain-containing protein [Bacillaceae bacterium]|nr:DUF1189 domain-containing protein [Bacillaceae bacterium]